MKKYIYVGFWKRLVMGALDSFIILGFSFLVLCLFTDKSFLLGEKTSLIRPVINVLWIIPLLYNMIFWKLKGATPGKIIRRVKIVDAKTGKIPSLWALMIRHLGYSISNVFFLGFLWIALDSRKQAWHDKIAGTVVIKHNTKKILNTKDELPDDISNIPFFPTQPKSRDIKLWTAGKLLFSLSIVILIAFSIIINVDAKLLPEAEEWLFEPEFVENNPRDNGFYHLVGIEAPGDCFEAGYKFVNENNKYIVEAEKNRHTEDTTVEQHRIDFDIKYSIMIESFNGNNFMEYCQGIKDSIFENYEKYKFIDTRFNDVLNSKYFKNTITPHSASKTPLFMGLVNYKLLKLSYLSNLYIDGEKEKAIEMLEKDLEQNRSLATKSDEMILKLVSAILIRRNLQLFNIWLDYDNSTPMLFNSISNLPQISFSERNMELVAKDNFLRTSSMFLSTFNPDNAIENSKTT